MTTIIARQPLPSPTQLDVRVDLVALLEAALPQVYGSDERQLLDDWLQRNTSDQLVYVPLSIIQPGNGCLRAARRLRANNPPIPQIRVHPELVEGKETLS
jgi:hypothetical protein